MVTSAIPAAKRFVRGDRIYVQAQQIWLILCAFVMHSDKTSGRPTTLTYGDLAAKMGYKDRRAGHMLARQLGIVGEYCRINELPALNAIVVNQNTGIPGDEVVLSVAKTILAEQKAVMREDWFGIRVPTSGTFRKVWQINA